jgi:enolase
MGVEVFHSLKSVLKSKGYNTAVGDEGGFAPNLKSNIEAIEVILEAIEKSEYKAGKDVFLALTPQRANFYEDGKYIFFKSDKSEKTPEQMVKFYEELVKQLSDYIN